MTERFANDASSTLAAGIDADDTDLTVASAATFPADGDFRVRIGDEILIVTDVTGAVFTVTRGAESTTAATHAAGVAVTHVLTSGSLATLVSEVTQAELDAEATARAAAITAEASTRSAADVALDGRVDALEVAPPAHTHDDRYYTETEVDALLESAGSGSAPEVVDAGNFGATESITVADNTEKWLVGTLNADLVLTIDLGTGSRLKLLATQDATGGRSLTITDGIDTSELDIPADPAATVEVNCYSPNGSAIYVHSGIGPEGPTGEQGPVGDEGPAGPAGPVAPRVHIDVFLPPETQTNWNSIFTAATKALGSMESSGAQNAEIGWDVLLAAGVWDLSAMHVKYSNRGIYTVTLDGAALTTFGAGSSSFDGYAVGEANNVISTITGLVIPTTDVYRLLFKMATKHASSSSYVGAVQSVGLRRTA